MYRKLYSSGVCSILNYCSEVWGVKQFKQIEVIQHKPICIFLGVDKYPPLPAIHGIWIGHLVTLEGKLQCLDIGID